MKLLPLSNGGYTILDDEDFEYCDKWRWMRNNRGYVQRGTRVNRVAITVLLHRDIMRPKLGMTVDHINHNPLDNRKDNLRVCTTKENLQNKSLASNNKSGYKGVGKIGSKYRAMIRYEVNTHLGIFSNIEEAALAYDCAAIQVFGEYASLNILTQ